MADFNALETLINAYIKQNGVQAITGQVLNGVLRGMVSALGKGWTIAGDAEPTTDPGTMTGPVAYIAHTAGTYAHFGNLVVNEGEVAFLKYNEQTWTKEVLASLAAQATVDANVGTPSVGVSFVNGVLTFDFRNMKGDPGINGTDGAAAGFGVVNATVDANVGTPGVSVSSSGPDTAKNFTFAFTNLKGETGVTSAVVTVDNTSGAPACAVSLVGQELHLDFTGLKGAQGNPGSSVDYPFTLVNNLTTNDPDQALTAAMGYQLEGEISQLELQVGDLDELETEDNSSIVAAINEVVNRPSSGFPPEAADLLIEVLRMAVYNANNAGAVISELEDALNGTPPSSVVSIDAVFTQGDVKFYASDDLDDLRPYLVVTALLDGGESEVVTTYTLQGTLTPGTSTITVRYRGKTDTFTVNVENVIYRRGAGAVVSKLQCTASWTDYNPAAAVIDGETYYFTRVYYTGGTDATPRTRASYYLFDLALVAGKTYQYALKLGSIPNTVSIIQMGLQYYDETLRDAGVANERVETANYTSHVSDSGWQTLVYDSEDGYHKFSHQVPAGCVGVRITLRYGNNDRTQFSGTVDELLISEVTNNE